MKKIGFKCLTNIEDIIWNCLNKLRLSSNKLGFLQL